jgi:hypothetical protein
VSFSIAQACIALLFRGVFVGKTSVLARIPMKAASAVLCFLMALSSASAAEFYVATSGAAANPGTKDKPFATLDEARDAIRALKAHGPLTEPVRVIVSGGTYRLANPFVLTPEDSGTAKATISYEAAPGERPVFTGGRAIGGWQQAENGLWKTKVTEVASGTWYFEQLWINGRRAMRAKTPNEFYFYMQNIEESAADPGSGKEAKQTVTLRPEDFAAVAKLTPQALHDVNLVVFHKWDVTRRFLDSIDVGGSALVTSGGKMKSWNPWTKNTAFILENFKGALDAPGEWFLERDGSLYYVPRPGERIEDLSAVAPVAEKLVLITGDPAKERFVEHVALKGLAFQHGQWLTPPQGFEPAQAAAPIEAAVMIDGARNVTIENCEVAHVGGYGVWFRRGCHDCTLRHCLIEDLGAGGARIGESGILPDGPQRTGHVTFDNNIIRRGGRIFPCAVGVWIGQSGDNTVSHNEIADFFYTGISAGWTWGYGEGLAKRNAIAFNHVHHIGQGVLSDMGGIYTLGPSEGTIVRNNVFHDVYASTYGGWGLYTDEGSTGITFENNLVYDTKTGSFHQHYGKENIVRNNILAFSELQQLQATRAEDHLSFTLENNIVIWDRGELLAGAWDKVKFAGGRNLFWQTKGQPVTFAGHSLTDWQSLGHEQGSIVADPKCANVASRDFTLASDSPALRLGFIPFDASAAGVYGDPDWQKVARSAQYEPLHVAPPPP